jgi:hypothetical protein
MTELVQSWLSYSRQQAAMLDRITSLVRVTDMKYRADEDVRHQQLKEIQNAWYRVVLAEKLALAAGRRRLSPQQLLDAADEILNKKGHGATTVPSSQKRTAAEERMYTSLRVRWSKLLREAKVRCADTRGGPFNRHGRGGERQ